MFSKHWNPSSFPFVEQIIAPYWDDTDLQNKGGVYMDLYSAENGSEVLKNISTFINSDQNACSLFKPTSAVVVEWRNICPYRNNRCNQVQNTNNANYSYYYLKENDV